MALKTLQVPSSFARPINRSIIGSSSSQNSLRPKPASAGLAASVAGQRRRWRRSTVECRGGSNLHGCVDEGAAAASRRRQEQAAEIPIVLFPSVVFPGATVQLQAFEFRYRIMVHTLLQEGVTRFGVVYSGGGVGGGVAAGEVGCVAHVVECERLVDGRFFLTCVGGDRFRVVGAVRTKPYVVARVQPLADAPPSQECGGGGDMVRHLVERVEEQLKNVAALSDKLGWSRPPSPPLPFRATCSPSSLSFAVAREVVEDREEQQALLRLDDAAARLAREGRYLERRSRYLAAIAAIKDALGGHLYCNDKNDEVLLLGGR
uniref:Lon N-terminal domain-containing protein n=1 Tax=Oryza meridionalis TaxID=40149 RepID=A0A0E0D208_9ORYZ